MATVELTWFLQSDGLPNIAITADYLAILRNNARNKRELV